MLHSDSELALGLCLGPAATRATTTWIAERTLVCARASIFSSTSPLAKRAGTNNWRGTMRPCYKSMKKSLLTKKTLLTTVHIRFQQWGAKQSTFGGKQGVTASTGSISGFDTCSYCEYSQHFGQLYSCGLCILPVFPNISGFGTAETARACSIMVCYKQ